jgi:hypothetical protein
MTDCTHKHPHRIYETHTKCTRCGTKFPTGAK